MDVARSGNDETVLALIVDDTLVHMEPWHGQDTMRTVGRVREWSDAYAPAAPPAQPKRDPDDPDRSYSETFLGRKKAEVPKRREAILTIAIDDGGVGGGVVDRLREQGVSLHAVSFGAAAGDRAKQRFKNKLAEMYWRLREQFQGGAFRFAANLPQAVRAKLWAQLTQIEFALESDRAIRVYKRGIDGHATSPDYADALVLALEARHQGAYAHLGVYL